MRTEMQKDKQPPKNTGWVSMFPKDISIDNSQEEMEHVSTNKLSEALSSFFLCNYGFQCDQQFIDQLNILNGLDSKGTIPRTK